MTINNLLFKRRPYFGLKTFLFAFIAIVLMKLDGSWMAFHRWRDRLDVLTYPVQQMVNVPIKLVICYLILK